MFSYEMFCNKMQRFSEEKVKNTVYAYWYGNTIKIFLVMIVLFDILRLLIGRVNGTLYYVLTICIVFIVFGYISSRKAGVSLSDNRLIYVKFGHIGYREKEVFEIPFEKMKALTVMKFFNVRLVKMSFISNQGRLEKKRFYFSSVLLGRNYREYKENSQRIFEKLVEMQKILDRGDF